MLLSQQLMVQSGAVPLTAAHVLVPHIMTEIAAESQVGGTTHLPTGPPWTAARTPQRSMLSQQLTVQACAEPLTAGHALVPHIDTEDTAESQVGSGWHLLTPSSVAVRVPHSPCAVQQLTVQACAELLRAGQLLVPHIGTDDTAGSQVALAIMPPSGAPALPPASLSVLPPAPVPALPPPAPPLVPLTPVVVPESWPLLPPDPAVLLPAAPLSATDPSRRATGWLE